MHINTEKREENNGKNMLMGSLALVLHAHLPFVRHPEYPDMMEERWLYEAITETYIPLIEVFEKLELDGCSFRLTMSVTPPLAAMLSDDLLQERYEKHISKLVELAEKEVDRTRWLPEFHDSALNYLDRFTRTRRLFRDTYGGNILRAFKKFQDRGFLEIITCNATHGYLPFMERIVPAKRAQIETAVVDYERHFGRFPRGIWLAECAFNPGDDEILAQYGLKFFFTDAHGVLFANPRPRFGTFAPIICPSGIAAFARDLESSKQVWSSFEGYPGDFDYREFYRDIGFDLDFEYIRPYIHESGTRLNTGIKYHRITGRNDEPKQPYNFRNAALKAKEHAGHFIMCREKQFEHLNSMIKDRKPLVVSPYDAELFGHWWFEGPQFIYHLLQKASQAESKIHLITPAVYLEENPKNQLATPCASSWGHNGYHEFWLNESNAWIYPHLHMASERMNELADRFLAADDILMRALNQAAREVLLMQASDWAFIMRTGTTVPYAVKRTKDHCSRFNRLYEDILSDTIDEEWLSEVEWRDNIFPCMDYRVYGSKYIPDLKRFKSELQS